MPPRPTLWVPSVRPSAPRSRRTSPTARPAGPRCSHSAKWLGCWRMPPLQRRPRQRCASASSARRVGRGRPPPPASPARAALTRALAAARDTIAVRDSLVVTLLAPDVGPAALAASGKPPSARLFWSPSRHRVVMAVFNLAPAPAGRIYQLWAIAGGKPISLGLFNTAPDGRVTVAMDVARELASFQLTAVTEEPAGGSLQPTQQPFLVGKLSGGE